MPEKIYTEKEVKELIEKERQSWEKSLSASVDQLGAKRLPRNERGEILNIWKTDRHTYRVIPIESLPIERLETFQNFSIGFGVDKNFAQIVEIGKKVQEAIFRDTNIAQARRETYMLVDALINPLREIGEGRTSAMYYMAAILTKIDDEDITVFDEALATEKINDWKSYGYAGQDFFFFVGQRVPGFGSYWNNLKEAVR